MTDYSPSNLIFMLGHVLTAFQHLDYHLYAVTGQNSAGIPVLHPLPVTQLQLHTSYFASPHDLFPSRSLDIRLEEKTVPFANFTLDVSAFTTLPTGVTVREARTPPSLSQQFSAFLNGSSPPEQKQGKPVHLNYFEFVNVLEHLANASVANGRKK